MVRKRCTGRSVPCRCRLFEARAKEFVAMNVLVLLPYLYDSVPGQRFRIEQWARMLELRGSTSTSCRLSPESLNLFYTPGITSRKRLVNSFVASIAGWGFWPIWVAVGM